jgi:phospholipid/cholesterol/gamma-HCH transport system permease protein
VSVLRLLELTGTLVLSGFAYFRDGLEDLGRGMMLLGQAVVWLFRRPFRIHELARQLDFLGVQSSGLILVTGMFTGMVLALQTHIALSRYGSQSLVGAMVGLSLTRELGPVLSALMVIGRAGSAMTAELGTMRNTQQIDALASMAVEPVQYLVVPRILATTLIMPGLALLFEFSGMAGACLIFCAQLGGQSGEFLSSVRDYLTIQDVTHGLFKALVFGLVISLASCTKGFYVTGGARGVGNATTRSVVISSLLVLASDYFMTSLMFSPS